MESIMNELDMKTPRYRVLSCMGTPCPHSGFSQQYHSHNGPSDIFETHDEKIAHQFRQDCERGTIYPNDPILDTPYTIYRFIPEELNEDQRNIWIAWQELCVVAELYKKAQQKYLVLVKE